MQVASAPTQVLSPKRLRPASNPPLALTTPNTVVSTLPPVISSHILNNNYLLASQSQAAAAAVANYPHPHHHHPLAPFHHPQASPILQNFPIAASTPALTQIKSIITSSSPTATIPTQIPSFIATAQQQQQIKSINTSSGYSSPSPVATTVIPISQTPTVVESSNLATLSPSSSTTSVATNTVTGSNISNMDPVGQMGQNPMQSHPLSQSMDSVNTASNEEEVSHSHFITGACTSRMSCVISNICLFRFSHGKFLCEKKNYVQLVPICSTRSDVKEKLSKRQFKREQNKL